ncbi:hypothetical protein D9757_006786 [Collybiopsis confluens]|uniref:Carboxylic ester hydrolase n=1 Tax=Collybiopsis confluens TaxID=2823264 RepID=A0A8H5HLU0_9AGAR|nr:hypothetical protein D9757_006786 [Collybiopsis confluens]
MTFFRALIILLVGLTAQTQQGPVLGTSPVQTVRQFLGIPYATAKRWQAPTPPRNRTETFDASKFGDSCPQQLNAYNIEFLRTAWGGLTDEEIFVNESEDCLNLNIWAPAVDRGQKTAVLIWMFGGSFVFGTSNMPFYNGLNIVKDNDDIIVVTINYRLNVFGQPNAPQLNPSSDSAAQNFCLLDADAAIQWVYENIAFFGGDPERITIFGQSAGAELVDAYTYSHVNDTIVKGVIAQSGSILGNTGLVAGETSLDEADWNDVASIVGCGNVTDSAQLACMQNASTTALSEAVNGMSTQFRLVLDNVTVFADTKTRAASGNFLKVPMLTGTTANEGDIIVAVAELELLGITVQPVLDILSSIYTMQTSCPVAETAAYRIAAGGIVFRYEYQAVFPNLSPIPQLRAYHTSEIPLVFGTYNHSTLSSPSTENEIILSETIQRAWVLFARDPKGGLLREMGWPGYDLQRPTIATLGNYKNATGWGLEAPSPGIDLLCGNLTFFDGIFGEVGGLLAAL